MPGAAAGLVRAADDAEVRDAAARLAEREVPDVVVRRADDLADHEARSGGARAARDLRLREAGGRAARTVGRRRGVPRVEVEEVVVRDQLHPDREVVLVDLADPVHQRDLRGGDVRNAVVRRVPRVGDHGEPVEPEHVTGRRIDGRVVVADDLVARERGGVAVRGLDRVRLEVPGGIGDEADVEGARRVGGRVQRPRGKAPGRIGDRDRDRRVLREGAAAERDGVGRVVVALVHRDLGGLRVPLDERAVRVDCTSRPK